MAVTLTAPDLAGILNIEQNTATRLLSVAAELVNEYAPNAPESVQNEAAIRCAGWLNESAGGFGYVARERIGPHEVTYKANEKGALYHSGGAALLTRWKRRRAGAL